MGMGMSKDRLPQCPSAHQLSMSTVESSWEVEARARGKTIPGEMFSAPAVGLRGSGGMDMCPASLYHACMHVGNASPGFHGVPSEELGEDPSASTCACTLA